MSSVAFTYHVGEYFFMMMQFYTVSNANVVAVCPVIPYAMWDMKMICLWGARSRLLQQLMQYFYTKKYARLYYRTGVKLKQQ